MGVCHLNELHSSLFKKKERKDFQLSFFHIFLIDKNPGKYKSQGRSRRGVPRREMGNSLWGYMGH